MPAKACTPRVVVALLVILACALALRLYGIGFGLPALLDPDEPLFIISALKLLGQHTLNPGWFGHPGTTTIYSLAIIYASIGGAALASRQFADISSFVAYVYNDPGILVLSGRIFFALCGCACVALTFLLAKRLRSVGTGLLAALLLALNPLHISYSQLIRTDVQSSLFMLLCLLWTCRIVTNGGRRDYVIAGIWAGCACVTKWPAGVVDISLITAAVMRLRDHPSEARNQTCNLVIGLLVSLVTVVTVSPYLLLDYPVLLDNLRGEIQPDHVGASGGGFLANVAWYITGPLRGAIGVMGLLLACAGIGLAVRKSRVLTATVFPCATVSFVIICANTLIWERWLVPLLPFVAIFEAWALLSLANWLRGATSRRTASFIVATACAILLIPGLATTRLNANERTNDTRTLAAQWVLHHTSPGDSVLVEHFAFDLFVAKRRILFPAGDVGCVDAADVLGKKLQYGSVVQWRGTRSVVDFGNLPIAKLPTCEADIAIFSHYDRYRAERSRYPKETAAYERAMRLGRTLKIIMPEPGKIGGPAVRIIELDRHVLHDIAKGGAG